MADTKITDLTELAEAPASDDLLAVVDVSDSTMSASGTDKKLIPTHLFGKLELSRGQMLNGKIDVSVTSNNLTVALKGADGNDPSASNPVYCKIGDTVRSITSALSVTLNAGTNWFDIGSAVFATFEQQLFTYLGYNATDGVTIGVSRIPYANEYGDFSATSTVWDYCAISDISNAISGDDYEVIGRFSATLSAGAGYTWTVPTFDSTNLIQKLIDRTDKMECEPSLTGITIGNGTYDFKYFFDGKMCYLEGTLTLGSTSSVDATNNINMPVPISMDDGFALNGNLTYFEDGVNRYPGIFHGTGNAIRLRVHNISGSYALYTNVSSTIPFTWGENDQIAVSLMFPIAD